jgi:putative transposase
MARPPRLRGFSYRGPYRYLLTFLTLYRSRIFADATAVQQTLGQITRTAAIERFAILAYCFMPDHLHLVVSGMSSESDLKRFAKLAKQRSGAARAHARCGPLWQPGYWETLLRSNDDVRAATEYVLNNPLNAGLVTRAADYPFAGSDRTALSKLV